MRIINVQRDIYKEKYRKFVHLLTFVKLLPVFLCYCPLLCRLSDSKAPAKHRPPRYS
nr:MAG TPA: hypothetical protein [Caudoviricetes sp.]